MDNGLGNPYLSRFIGIVSAALAAVAFFSALLFGGAFFVRAKAVAAHSRQTAPVSTSDLGACRDDVVDDSSIDQLPEIPENLLPGNLLPRPCMCSWPSGIPHDVGYCAVYVHGRKIYLGYETDRRRIVNVSYAGQGKPVGDLLLAWGMPTGIRRYSWSVEVYWGNRSAYVSNKPFGPKSKTLFIMYTSDRPKTEPWHGFTGGQN
jgi:hypothetical protein